MKLLSSYTISFLLAITLCAAQETLNANDPNSFIFGGDQKSSGLTVNLLPVAIVDVEPDPGSPIGNSATPENMEAGLPIAGAAESLDNLWLNFSYRARGFQFARIYVAANQPIPDGMAITVEIIAAGTGGQFFKNTSFRKINLSQSDQPVAFILGNGYTGDGLGNGYRLSYVIDNPNGAPLPEGFEVIYNIR